MRQVFLLLTVTVALLLTLGSDSPASAAIEVETGLDVDTTGNAALSLGSHETCAEIASVGDTFQVDAVVRGVPPFDPEGLPPYNQWTYPGGVAGVQFFLYYDAAVVKVTGLDAALMLTAAPPSSTPISFSDPLPDSDGEFLVAEADLSGNAESGEGVLVRMTFEAVGEGTTVLDITPADEVEPVVAGNTGYAYDLTYLADAEVMVGGSCSQGVLDNDGDEFADGVEMYVGTLPLQACPQTTAANDETSDAWPPDFNDDTTADVFDANALKPAFFSTPPGPPYTSRVDLNTDSTVDIFDVNVFKPFFFESCTP